MFSIYLLTNATNDKKYVGVTGNLPRRLRAHKHSGQPKTYSPQRYLSRAIRKYGWDHFHCRVLETAPNKTQAWRVLEPKYIIKYQTQDPAHGYNLTSGGDGAPGRTHTETAKQKMSDNHWLHRSGSVHPMLKKQHSHQSRLAVGRKNSFFVWTCVSPAGVTYTTETIGMFVAEHHLNIDAVYHFMGRIVPSPPSRVGVVTPERDNTTGWFISRSPKAGALGIPVIEPSAE